MADTPWYQAPNAVRLRASFEEGAQDASKSQTAATEAERKRYELEAEKHIQELAAKSIGPDGNFSLKTFRQALAADKYALSGLKAYASDIYPQAQKEAGQQNVPKILTEEGGVDPTKVVSTARESEFGGDVARAGLGMQADIAKTAQGVAGAKQDVALLTEPGAALAMSMQGIAESTPRPLGSVGAPKITADDVKKWAPDVSEARRDWLEAKGMPVGADAATVAKWYNEGMEAKIRAATLGAYDQQKPGSMVGAVARAGQAAQEYAGEATEKGRGIKSTVQAQASSEFGLKKGKLELEQEQDPIKFYREGPEKIAANASNIGEIQKMFGKRGVIENAMDLTEDLRKRVKKGEFNGNPDAFNAETASIQQAIGYSEDANTEGGRTTLFSPFRSSKSFGAVVNEGGGPINILERMAKNATATQSQEEYLELMHGALKNLRTSGINEGNIRKLPRLVHWSQRPDGSKPTKAGTVKPKPEPTYLRGRVE